MALRTISTRFHLSKQGACMARCFSTVSHIVSPRNFGANFRINNPISESEKVLKIQNAHPLDSAISFREEDHTYLLDGQPVSSSVTQLVSKFFSSFDQDLIISKMMNGNKWPREGYINKDGTPFTEEQIRNRWDSIGLNGRNRGTWMHANIERYFNGLPSAEDLPEFKQFRAFVDSEIKANGVMPYRTEWSISGKDENICGTVDFIGQLPDKTFMLVDWKRMQNLNDSLSNLYGNTAKDPFSNYDDCDGVKYLVQLNIYKYLLEKYYGIEISSTKLVCFHPNQKEEFKQIDVPDMQTEVAAMFAGMNVR